MYIYELNRTFFDLRILVTSLVYSNSSNCLTGIRLWHWCISQLCFKHEPLSTKRKDLKHNQDNMSSGWVIDCYLTPIHQFFSYIMARKKVNFQWDDEVRFVLDKHAELNFYSASSLKQVRGYTCRSTWKHYTDSEPISLCSFYLMLRA